MNLKKNEIEIIKLLISSPQYISSYDIATATGINRRLVRDEMAHLKIILKDLGYELISKTSKGYMISVKSKNSLQKLQNFIEDAQRQRDSLFPTQPWERSNYILKRLIDIDDYIKIDQLADELLVSRSTISHDIKHCKKAMKKYSLHLLQKPNYGIKILGDEINKRKPICDLMFTNLRQSEMFYDYLNSFISEPSSLEYGILNIIKKHHIEMSDFALCDFLLTLSVSLSRIILNKTISKSVDLTPIQDRQEFIAALDIARFIEERNDIHINKNERDWIAIELICKRSTKGLTFHNNPVVTKIVDEIFISIKEQTLLQFHNPQFYTVFSLYVENALLRIQYDEKIRNPLYDELKTTYPLGYTLAEISSSIIEKYTKKSLSMSELAFFAIIFNNALFNRHTPKKRVLLLCGLGGGAQDLSAYQILERFENQIDIVKTSQYYKLPDEDLSCYDFIISTVPIHRTLPIPSINISPIITSDDLDKIHNDLSYQFNSIHLEMYFLPQLYKKHVRARNKNEVIHEFYELIKKQFPQIKESFKNHLSHTEDYQLILFPHQTALIRLNKPLINTHILSVLILNKKILWNKKEIQTFVLFSSTDTNHFLFNTLHDTLKKITHHPIDALNISSHLEYPDFLSLIVKHEAK